MAFTTYTNLHTTVYKDRVLNSTAETIASGTTVLFAVELDNTGNSAASYCKIWDAAPTVGTTNPELVYRVPASTKVTWVLGSNGEGLSLSGIYIAGVTTAGTAGSTSPTNDFVASLYTD